VEVTECEWPDWCGQVLELLQDSDDEERQELGRRAMMRTLAPQTTASFVYMMNDGKHPDDDSFSAMMRNASAVGFDAILSQPYNNHLPMNPKNASIVARFKALVELGKALPNPLMLGEYTCLQGKLSQVSNPTHSMCTHTFKGNQISVAAKLNIGVIEREWPDWSGRDEN
jgi:hypothetical protein